MSGLAVLALIREAHAALPNGTPQERTAWIMRRRREIEAGSARSKPVGSGPKPFADVADDPVIARLSAEDNR